MIYKPTKSLKVGYSYNITVDAITGYNGLKEITKISFITTKGAVSNYKSLFLDASKINLFDEKYQNEIITNLQGIYNKGYLYFNNQKIKLYFKNRKDKPSNNTKMIINQGHLGIYKTQIQVIIY